MVKLKWTICFFVIIASGSLLSCTTQKKFKTKVKSQKYKWQEQLHHALTFGNEQYKQRDDILRDLRIVGYKPVGRIKNQHQLKKEKEQVLAQVSELNSMPVTFFNFLQSQIKNPDTLEKKVDRLLKVGQRIIKVKWSFKDTTFITATFAYNSKGIIYDNVGTNITF